MDRLKDIALTLAYALPTVPTWMAYARHRTRQLARHAAIRSDAREAGLIEPPSLHPLVDPTTCIGCGGCVIACPEGDVLGLIGGKADLIDPTRCIGHGACAAACPVDAIQLVFGTATRGIDIPVVDRQFQTSVPGVYIAGELGGMGLIRNAVEQGRQAMAAIAQASAQEPDPADMLDAVVIGAGPAGISASLAAREAGLRCLTLDQDSIGGSVAQYPRGKVVMTEPVTLPGVGRLNFREISKEDLIGLWSKVVIDAGLDIAYHQRAMAVRPAGIGFEVETTDRRIRARRVLLAVGRRGTPRRLGVPGEAASKVVYRLIEPEQYHDRAVLVVGGGDSAVEAAITLADQPGTRVVLAHRSATFDRTRRANRRKLEQATAAGKLRCQTTTKVMAIAKENVTLSTSAGVTTIPNDDVIICAGGVPPSALLETIGIALVRKHGTA